MIRLRTPRIFGERQSKEGVRDLIPLIVVACEGKTEEEYFRLFDKENTGGKIVKVRCLVLERKDPSDTKSAPVHVLDLLKEYKEHYHVESDELWMVVDRDRQNNPKAKLEEIVNQCREEGYNIVISNPTFELWLLLHIKNITEYDEETLEKIKANNRIGKSKKSRRFLSKELSDLLKGYKKGVIKQEIFLPKVKTAIKQARAIDRTNQPIDNFGTTVYLLAEKIVGVIK